jgi:tetratricopeptide (TPR) repeat protein
VKAHIAQQEGRLDDAVAEYRAFMARIEKDQKDQVDPIAGGRVTWEMILGLNARRIAELLTSAGKADEAAKALAEARGYYEKALARLDANSPEHKQVTETLKELSATP